MTRAALAAILATAAFTLAGCGSGFGADGDLVEATGNGERRSYAVSGFSGVALNGVDSIDIRTGPFSVVAEGDSATLDRIELRKSGDTLQVGRKNGRLSGFKGKHARIIITLPSLDRAHIAGSGNMTVADASGPFNASIAGSGNMTVAKLGSDTAKLSIAGSGNIAVNSGTAQTLTVSIAGSGNMSAPKLTAASAEISIAGSGNVNAHVTQSASISLIGSGDVAVTGGADCSISKIGTGKATCD